MRLFLALALSPEVRAALAAAVERLRSCRAPVRWVDPASLHLTVRFLGETDPGPSERLASLLRPLCAALPPFTLAVAGLGAFPTPARPRVVWAGVEEPSGSLALLAERVEGAVASLGLPGEDRPFSPHVTLGRAKPGVGLGALGEALRAGASTPFGRSRTEELLLLESRLAPSGARYQELARFPFLLAA